MALALASLCATHVIRAPAAPRVAMSLGRQRLASLSMSANPTAKFKTSLGEFSAELYMDKLPVTCSNFVDLAKNGYYDGLTFHRVIKGFMCQFGCPFSKDPKSPRAGTGGPQGGTSFALPDGTLIARSEGGNIPDELIAEITNDVGTLSMANTGMPDSGGSQFFINTNHNEFLDYFDMRTPSKHPVFGKVVDGMDVVRQIESTKTGPGDKPTTPVVMESITIID